MVNASWRTRPAPPPGRGRPGPQPPDHSRTHVRRRDRSGSSSAALTHLDVEQLADKTAGGYASRTCRPKPLLQRRLQRTPISQPRDIEYVRRRLGLVAGDPPLRIANPIYAEVVPARAHYGGPARAKVQELAVVRTTLDGQRITDERPRADSHGVSRTFFREHAESLRSKRFDYQEAGPQLLLQAFLQRVVNGGGRIEHGGHRPRPMAPHGDLLDRMAGEQRPFRHLTAWTARRTRKFVIECKVPAQESVERTIHDAASSSSTAAYMRPLRRRGGGISSSSTAATRTWLRTSVSPSALSPHRQRRGRTCGVCDAITFICAEPASGTLEEREVPVTAYRLTKETYSMPPKHRSQHRTESAACVTVLVMMRVGLRAESDDVQDAGLPVDRTSMRPSSWQPN